ncbi:MAG TPA: SIS domain-containing protein [Acidimicrobiales bacterium]|nr:SIS domain-containing protein [Acidimicrobiales bacterium]
MRSDARPWTDGVLDTRSLIAAAAGLPEQLAAAAGAVSLRSAQPVGHDPDALVVVGIGPDAAPGEMLAAAGVSELTVPVVVTSGPRLPGFVTRQTLVIALAGAAAAPETVAAARDALGRGASLVAIAPPGDLAELASANEATVHLLVDGAGGRTALGSVLGALLATCETWGLWHGATGAARCAAGALAARRDALLAPDGGIARSVARRIGGTFASVHGAAGVGAVAARRWADQIAMSAKAPAFAGEEPGRSVAAVAGFGQHGDVTRQVFTLVELRTDGEGEIAAARFAAVQELAREAVAGIVEVQAVGPDPLAQLLDLVLVGDFAAIQLAAAVGLDPGPVPAVDEVSRAVASGRPRDADPTNESTRSRLATGGP